MALTPWHKSATPRVDLRKGKPLDDAEFAVNLDRVRDGKAPDDYKDPKQFFERTYLTKNLTALAAEVQRRFSGIKTETSAVFNMATQFGGGKTHALTLLYHLARNGPAANGWPGVDKILAKAGLNSVPGAAIAVFVGTEFDSITGKGGGASGEPLRKTPWGEIAFQLSGTQGFDLVEEHDRQRIAPGGDVIRSFLPKDRPCLILMDELMNYVSRNRDSGLSDQLYNFIQNLTNVASGEDKAIVLLPESENGAGNAVFSPDGGMVAWKESSGTNLLLMNYAPLLRAAAVHGDALHLLPASLFEAASGYAVADLDMVGFVDEQRLLVSVMSESGAREVWLVDLGAEGPGLLRLGEGVFAGFLYP